MIDKNDKIVPELEDILTSWFNDYSIEVDRDAMFEEARLLEERQAKENEEEGVQVATATRRKDDQLLVSNMDDEKMLFNESEVKDGADDEGEIDYKISSGSKEQAEDTSMHPTSSHEVDQQEDGYGQAAGGRRGISRMERLCDLKDTIRELSASICAAISDRYEPVDKLINLNYHLEARHDEVWQMLNTPTKLLKRPVDEDEEDEAKDDSKGPSGDQEMDAGSRQQSQQIESSAQ